MIILVLGQKIKKVQELFFLKQNKNLDVVKHVTNINAKRIEKCHV